MAASVKRGYVVFRLWDEKQGLSEATWNFHSLDELYGLCLQSGSALLVDRIVIEGSDDEEVPKLLTLIFQSISAGMRLQDYPGQL